ncbi:MAG: GNAT family N-acetyltransferase [Verrucomicrobiota bacterium]
MEKIEENDLTIRQATPEDVGSILGMVRELAEFEELGDEVVATEEDFEDSLFGESPAAEALLAERGGKAVGYAIFFSTFSTFVGKAGIWLEDLYVKPDHRKGGIGKALLKAVGAIAEERGAGRYEWSVLDWNSNAIQLYRKMGGDIMDDWRIVRLDRTALKALPGK